MVGERIERTTLNRTTLQRQHLLSRSEHSVLEVISHLIGLQAQIPQDPYVGLWSRSADFEPDSLSQLLNARSALRMVSLRGTIHLLSAADAVGLRAYAQEALDQELRSHGEHKHHLADVDLEPVIAFAKPLLTANALTPTELRALLQLEFPHLNAGALALACRNRLPLVQTPPRGLWQQSGGLRLMTLEGWVGTDSAAISEVQSQAIVRRYLRAFGPASAQDIVTWSRSPLLGRTMENMATELRQYTTANSRPLFDLADAELMPGDSIAPPRFLPEYDNLLLSHRDRSRFGDDSRRQQLGQASAIKGTVLIDGLVGAAWHISRDGRHKPASQSPATLTIEHLDTLASSTRHAVEAEADFLNRLLTPGAAEHRVRLVKLSD
ncbi:MAG: winged helix DNA-binding domain-containing protein [Actinomycetota bacterium]|nr:winged helix DNA-binding domain-containing protein [Actinomycetota bacterium]